MELKSPKAKKKTVSRLITWSRMIRTPLLILLLLGSSTCDNENDLSSELSNELSNVTFNSFNLSHRHRHNHNLQSEVKNVLSDIKYLRRHLSKEIVNFVMTDFLVDGEVENRVHYNGITAKETYVGTYGHGVRLRQLTDGRHLVQIIYAPNGEIQDCEYITSTKSTRNFLKTLRKELKTALDEEAYKITEKDNFIEDEKFTRHFHNVTFQILKDGAELPTEISSWLEYGKLKTECLQRHEEMRFLMENQNIVAKTSLARSRRSIRENFIVPGTKWCGAGQLAQEYNELGSDVHEDRCCRAHDNCKLNIGAFKRRFGYFNFRPFTVSHCRCDRRFRACLKLADTPVSNMVGKLFFNVVQSKCFVLKPVKVCIRRSWWGRCLKRGYTKQAFLRANLPY